MSIKSAYKEALDSIKNKASTFVQSLKSTPKVNASQNFNQSFSKGYSNWQAQQSLNQQRKNTGLIDIIKNTGNYFNPTKDTNPSTPKVDNFWTAKVPVGLDRAANVLPYAAKTVGPNLKQQLGVLLKTPKTVKSTLTSIDKKIPVGLKNIAYNLNPITATLQPAISLDNALGKPMQKLLDTEYNYLNKKGEELIGKGTEAKQKIQLEKEKKVGITPEHGKFLENIKDPRYVADILAWQAPQFAVDLGLQAAIAYLTGGTGTVAKIVSFSPLYLSSATEAYTDAKASNSNMDDTTAMQVASGVGVINGLLDKIGFDTIFGKMFTKKVNSSIVKEVRGSLVKNIFRELGKVLKSGGTEGATEGMQQLILNASAKTFYDHERDLFNQVPENAFFGAVMGSMAKVGIEIPQVKMQETQQNNKLKATSQKVLGAKASDYNSATDFAEAEFGSNPETQIGFTNPQNITINQQLDQNIIKRLSYILKTGTQLDPIEITTNEQGQLTTVGPDGANRLAAYQALNLPAPVVNKSNIKLPELLTINDVFNEEVSNQPKQETPQSLITEEMKQFKIKDSKTIQNIGANETTPVGTKFDTDAKEGMTVIKSVLSNKQLDDLQLITAGEKDIINPDTGELAWGKYYDSVVSVVEQNGKVQSGTLYHEAFHYYADKLADQTLYSEALKEAKEEGPMTIGDKEYTDPSEYLADNFALFVEGRTSFSGKIQAFFQDLLYQVREMIGKANNIEMLYYNAIGGKQTQTVSETITPPEYRVTGEKLETGTQKVLDFLNEAQTPEDALKRIDLLKQKAITNQDNFQIFKKALSKYKASLVTGKGLPRLPENEAILNVIDKIEATPIKDIPKAPDLSSQTAENITQAPEIPKVEEIPQVPEEIKPITQEEVDNFDSQAYVKSEEERRKAAKVASTEPASILDKIKNVIKTIRYDLVESFSPITDVLDRAEIKYKFKILPTKDIRYQIDRVLRSSSLGDQFAKDNGLVEVVWNAPDLDLMSQYLIARQAQDLEKLDIKTGRDSRKDTLLVKQLEGTEYQKLAEKLIDTYRVKLLEYDVATGLISEYIKDLLIKKYPHYVPSQRVFDEIESSRGKFMSPKQVASIAEQTIIKEIKGSERAIEDPLANLFLQTRQAFEQGERNQAASMLASYKDLPGNPFDIKQLRSAEDVLKRIDLLSEAKELTSIKKPLERILKTRKGWLRGLMTELNALNKRGLQISLKPTQTGYTADVVAKLEEKISSNVEFGEGDLRDVVVWINGKEEPSYDYKVLQPKLRNNEVKRIINNLIKLDPKGIKLIRNKIANRDAKVSKLMDEVENIKTEVDKINTDRSKLLEEAFLLREASSRGKAIISTLKNGIKEIYEIDPEIERAAKSMDKTSLHGFSKVLNGFARILQLGATGVNIPFVVFNVAKDQITSIINSDHALQTSLANPINVVNALGAAVLHNNLYSEWVRVGASGTMFDISRDNPQQSLASIRARKNLKSKIMYTVTNPDTYIAAIENLIGRGEEFTRIQQYSGMKKALLAEGRTEADATILAANASRFNTANFARAGSFARMANYYVPYLNAGIQSVRSFDKALISRPIPTIMKLVSLIYLPMAAATLWNTGDEERKRAYGDIQEWEREDNFILIPEHPVYDKVRKQWNVIKIPLPPGLSNLASLIRRPLEQLVGLDPVAAKEIFDDLIQATTSFDASQVGNNLPQAFKPGVEVTTNKDLFTGNDIVPSYMKTWDKQDQVYPYTSGTAIALGQAFGMSPIMVEKEIATIGGGTAKQILNAVDTGLNVAGVIPKEQIGGESVMENIVNRTTKARGGNEAKDIYSETDKMANEKSKNKKEIIASINGEITPSVDNIKKAVAGLDKEEASSVIDAAFNDKLRSAMDLTEQAIQSSTKTEREQLAISKPELIPTINVVNQKEAISKIQSKIVKATLVAPDVTGLSETAATKVKRSNDFKIIHDLEDSIREMGLSENALASEYKRYGISPEDSTYDKLTALPDDLQLDEIKSQVGGLQGEDLLTALIAMRYVSEGTRKSLLTDALVKDLVDEGIIRDSEGDLLTSMVWNKKTGKFEKKATGGGGKIKKLSITIPKIKTLKAPKLGTSIKMRSYADLKPLSVSTSVKIPKPPKSAIMKPTKISVKSLTANLRSPVKNIYNLGRAA